MVQRNRLSNPRKLLVSAANWIGDAVMSVPALEALRKCYPGAEIVLLAKPWVSELYWSHPAASRLIIYDPDGEHAGPRGFWKIVQALRSERFEAAILFRNSFHSAWMAWCARIPARVGYARDCRSALLTDGIEAPPAAAYGHQSSYYLQLLFRAGLIEKPEPVQSVRLVVSDAEKKWAEKRLESLGLQGRRFLVGLNPGASFGPAKRWLLERFADLADRLVGGLQADVLIFGSREEKPLAEEVTKEMKQKSTVLAGETTLRQLMALLSRCSLVVTNDSGPMHLAAALGLPLVAIFGSTDERATGPLGPHTRVVKRPVSCSPCGLRECPIDFRCMTGVSVDDVYRAALELVKETKA